MHLIDTDVIIWVLRNNQKYKKLLKKLSGKGVLYISTITIAEVYKNIYPTEYTDTEEILNQFRGLDVTPPIAKQGGFYWQEHHKNLQNLNYNSDTIKLIKEHPKNASDIVSMFSDIPPDVDMIVMNHHERPDGKGFPLNLNHTRISPISSLFIVAHELVDFIYENEGKDKISDFLKKNEDQYSQGYFKKVFQVLKDLALAE